MKNCFLKAEWIRKKLVYIPGDDWYEVLILKVVKKNVARVKKIQWTSKDKEVATGSDKGIVKGIKKGSTVVNATVKYKAKGASKFKSKKLSCKVTVKG